MNRLLREVLPVLGLEIGYAAAHLEIGPGRYLPGPLPTDELAVGSVALAGVAAEALLDSGRVDVDPAQVRVSMLGEQVQTLDGAGWESDLSWTGFFPAADGWVRTHADYASHRERLAAALALDAGADAGELAATLRQHPAQQVEDDVTAAGGVAVRVRQQPEWSDSGAGSAASTTPVLRVRRLARTRPPVAEERRPRVLDLTRGVAGPVATRTLAFLGCEVLRIGDPNQPELPARHAATGAGKRSALLDLRRSADLDRLHGLLAEAEILVTGYRPGALDRFGLGPGDVAARHPHLVHGLVSAWGPAGPWAGRRGFDCTVQAASGIAWTLSPDRSAPVALPVPVLDHATSYLLTAGLLTALWRREFDGGTWRVDAHLASTAAWLLSHGAGPLEVDPAPEDAPYLTESQTAYGCVRQSRPAFTMPELESFPFPPREWGADEPRWAS